MPQFVNDYFPETFVQQKLVPRHTVLLVAQAENGGNTGISLVLGLTKDIGKNGYVKINLEQSHGFNPIDGVFRMNQLEQTIGIVLFSGGIKIRGNVVVELLNRNRLSENHPDIISQPIEKFFLKPTV